MEERNKWNLLLQEKNSSWELSLEKERHHWESSVLEQKRREWEAEYLALHPQNKTEVVIQ